MPPRDLPHPGARRKLSATTFVPKRRVVHSPPLTHDLNTLRPPVAALPWLPLAATVAALPLPRAMPQSRPATDQLSKAALAGGIRVNDGIV